MWKQDKTATVVKRNDRFTFEDGSVRHVDQWWLIPSLFGENRCLGLCSEMSKEEAYTKAEGLGYILNRYQVRYYDPKQSKRGRGVQTVVFSNKIEAELFASTKNLYSKPCKVEEV